MKVFVYWNLRKKLFSVKALQGINKGKVIAHLPELYLDSVRFRVSAGGRARVLREQRKNVHAGVEGTFAFANERVYAMSITYDPYKHDSFVKVADGESVQSANHVRLSSSDKRASVHAVYAW